MNVSGESNNIKYTVEPQFIDAGSQLFNKPVDKDIIIANQVCVCVRARWHHHCQPAVRMLFFCSGKNAKHQAGNS